MGSLKKLFVIYIKKPVGPPLGLIYLEIFANLAYFTVPVFNNASFADPRTERITDAEIITILVLILSTCELFTIQQLKNLTFAEYATPK